MNLKVEIHEVNDKGLHRIHVSATVNGRKHNTTMEILEDEMTSHFDYFFDMMRYTLRTHILEEQDARKKPEVEKDA